MHTSKFIKYFWNGSYCNTGMLFSGNKTNVRSFKIESWKASAANKGVKLLKRSPYQQIRHAFARKKPPYKHIVQVGDPGLRKKCQLIPRNEITNPSNQKLIEHLTKMMRSRRLMSLSAPQIGVPVQLFVAECTERHLRSYEEDARQELVTFPLKVIVNPRLEIVDKEVVIDSEGCYSLHSYCADVPRHKTVKINAFNAQGEAMEWFASGNAARIAQHEMDHMDGILFIDRMLPRTFSDVNWALYNDQGRLFW